MMMMLLALVRPAGARSLCTTTLLPCLLLPNRPRSGPINSSHIPRRAFVDTLPYLPYLPTILSSITPSSSRQVGAVQYNTRDRRPQIRFSSPRATLLWTSRSFRSFRKGQTCFFFFFFTRGSVRVCLSVWPPRRCGAVRSKNRPIDFV